MNSVVRRNGFVCVGRKDSEYYFINSVFKHGEGFQGVTGCTVRPVDAKEWEWACDRENCAERLQDVYETCHGNSAYRDDPDDDDFDRDDDFERFVDDVIHYDGEAHIHYDESYSCEASEVFDALGVEHECTDCIDRGRIFGRAGWRGRMDSEWFDEVFNLKALNAALYFEDGRGDVDFIGKMIFSKGF